MSGLLASGSTPKARRSRAKQACKACNLRRVRCNVMEYNPCSNCAASGALCEVVPSRRGRRPRVQLALQTPNNERNLTRRKSQESQEPFTPESHTAGERTDSVRGEHGPRLSQSPRRSQQSSISEVNDSSTQSAEQILFFGESNLLTSVATPSVTQNRMRYPISDAINIRASELFIENSLPTSSSKAHYLAEEGAFTLPDSEDCLAVLRAYFTWFHPCFPVVDRAEIANRYVRGEMSLLLLQAMLFIGASYCDENTVSRMGFKDRPEAKSQLYNRAKILYDADWESKEMTVLQSLFLISFWRAGPLNVKNTRYWLGSAISLAQARGYHRSPRSSPIGLKDAGLRKRIWWSIYVRDRQSSASLGLPSRIRDEDCDLEMLNYEDFESRDFCPLPDFLGNHTHEHEIYAVQMARLSQLLGKIIMNQFRPDRSHPDDEERLRLVTELEEWKEVLPKEMRSLEESTTPGSIWTYLLHLAYNYLHILLHRHAYTLPQTENRSPEGRQALQAACRVTRIVEDMLSQNLIQYGQMHLITSLFSSLCIHTIEIQRLHGVAKKIAEHRAQVCFLGLKEIQKYWEVNNLVLDLFFQHLDDKTAKRLRGGVAEHPQDKDFVSEDREDTVNGESVSQTLQADGAALLFTGDEVPGDDFPQIAQAATNYTSFIFDMPRNILDHGGSADDFNFFLDQCLFSNKDSSDLNDRQDLDEAGST